MWGAQEKSEGASSKNFGRRFAPALCPHLQIASDATVNAARRRVKQKQNWPVSDTQTELEINVRW